MVFSVMWIAYYILILITFVLAITNHAEANRRQKRYLIFTTGTQYGIFATISIPLHPETTVSVAWFFEANYYNVANATYFEPLLGDVTISRDRKQRSVNGHKGLTRSYIYIIIESMLEKHGYQGRQCLLRAICEAATSQYPHNGLLGDILHLILTALLSTCSSLKNERQRRGLIFPPTSLYGTFIAIAVPVDIPDKNVFVSYNFESNYSVLTNITQIDEVIYPNLPVISSRQSRSITRELAYMVLENRFKEYGMNGKECMLRNICEAAETPLHHNGLLGHIMHIIFTPSSSREEGIDDDYYEAEMEGQRGNCDRYLDDCPFSLFDVITRLVEIRS
ncbi:uncharacterized protein LOC113510741 [Galleria mellonella]|uniref:Uncharacterized protein LOC113510741 n=1 Tax=Galleria mellonella TaxID=7137 RepID=A0A6J3BP60_GALME|nr:uncharacterized protein LOC113510741 [Galleria mellonella]